MLTAELTRDEAAKVQELVTYFRTLAEFKSFSKIHFFVPYKKQSEHFALGKTKRERLFMAGNQLGKSDAGAVETAYHLTGDYPDDWKGRVWKRATDGWAAGDGATTVRDVQQTKLLGKPGVVEELGTGYIPKDRIIDVSGNRSATDAIDTLQVKHKSGGISTLAFKSYEQGRTKFQGGTKDFIWLDEEPKMDIYQECLTRITATRGMVFMTFTPLLGKSQVVCRYLDEYSPDRVVTSMTIDDVAAEAHGHITPEDVKTIVDGYLPHERDARAKGIPLFGSGRVFLVAESDFVIDQIRDVPLWWAKWASLDFGIGHPFAYAVLLWDRDSDIIYLHHCDRMGDQIPTFHVRAMRPIVGLLPVAWPHDGNARDKGSGKALSLQYKEEGLKMHEEHSQFEDGGYSLEASVLEMDTRLKTGRFKVSRHCESFLDEYRNYHRKEGVIVPVKDDVISAVRTGIMMKRIGKPMPLGMPHGGNRSRRQEFAIGTGDPVI